MVRQMRRYWKEAAQKIPMFPRTSPMDCRYGGKNKGSAQRVWQFIAMTINPSKQAATISPCFECQVLGEQYEVVDLSFVLNASILALVPWIESGNC